MRPCGEASRGNTNAHVHLATSFRICANLQARKIVFGSLIQVTERPLSVQYAVQITADHLQMEKI